MSKALWFLYGVAVGVILTVAEFSRGSGNYRESLWKTVRLAWGDVRDSYRAAS